MEVIHPVTDLAQADWIDLSAPDKDRLEAVAEHCGLSAALLAEPLDPKEHPRVEQNESVFLIVLRLAVDNWVPEDDYFGGTVPVGIFIQNDRLITVCSQAGLVEKLLRPVFEKRRQWSPILLLGCLFRACGSSFIKALEKLEELSSEAEVSLRRRPENDVLLDVMNIQKALIDITVALKSDYGLLEKFRQRQPFGLNVTKLEKGVLEEAMIETQQAVFTADIFGQVLSSLSDAFGSIISNNLNKIMKFLTGVTIVLMLPTLVSGLYGMNVELPGSNYSGAFWMLCGFCLALVLSVSFMFAKKKWF